MELYPLFSMVFFFSGVIAGFLFGLTIILVEFA